MGKLNKFYYAKAEAKKDLLLSADRVSGFQRESTSIRMHFNSLANPGDDAEGRIQVPLSDQKDAKAFVEDLVSASLNNPFVVLADDVAKSSVSSHYNSAGDITSAFIVS